MTRLFILALLIFSHFAIAQRYISKNGDYPVEVSGDLFIHGVTKPVTTKGTITVAGSAITARAKFIVAPKDYDIKIPSVVENNIAKEIEVSVDVSYNQN